MEAGAAGFNFHRAANINNLPRAHIGGTSSIPRNSSETMAPPRAAASKGANKIAPKSRNKAPAKASAGSAAAAPAVTPPKVPSRRSARKAAAADAAADAELSRIAAMNKANAEEERAREADEAGKGGRAPAGASAAAVDATATAARPGATTAGGGEPVGDGMDVEAAETTGGGDDSPAPARKRKATGSRADDLRRAFVAA